jgi:hypothetical protein
MWKFLILGLSVNAAPAALAEGFPARPESCELVSTAQRSDCEVENRYRCGSGSASFYWIEFFETDGLTTIARETSDFLLKDLIEPDGSGLYVTSTEGLHPRETLRAGTSTQRLEGHISLFGLRQPFISEGQLTATGTAVVLAEKAFQVIEGEFEFEMPNAGVTLTGQSIFAYQPDINIVIEIETSPYFGSRETKYIRELALPGQPGFGDEYPKHGCMSLSALKTRSLEAG